MIANSLIDSVLDLEDDDVFVDEIEFDQFEYILDDITVSPLNCSELTYVDVVEADSDLPGPGPSPCCCVDAQFP